MGRKKTLIILAALAMPVLLLASQNSQGAYKNDMTQPSGNTLILSGLPRQAELGFSTEVREGQIFVQGLVPNSPAQRAGLRDGDIINSINGMEFSQPYIGAAQLEKLDGGVEVTLGILGDDATSIFSFIPAPRPLEKLAGLDTEYGSLNTPDGAKLRTIVTFPKGSQSPLPAIFFIQWVSCDTVQFYDEGPWVALFREIAEESGMIFIRLERSANGDSEGPACHELDFETELVHYRYAFRQLVRNSDKIDQDKVFLLSNSLGGYLLPLVAENNGIAGAVVTSGGGLSYFERMVNFDRNALSNPNNIEDDPHQVLMDKIRFNTRYLLESMSPQEVVANHPDLEGIWEKILGTGNGVHYGRPFAFHQQAAKRDFVGAWKKVNAAILVLYNEYDQFESLQGAKIIVETTNSLRPGSAELRTMPKLGHSFYRYPSQNEAYMRTNREPANSEAAKVILKWLNRHN